MLADRIHRIAVPTPFPVGPVNVYLIEGERGGRPFLIDAGLRSDEAFAVLESGLVERGLTPRDIGAIILTHHHVDHGGGARRLQKLSGARVFAHPVDHTWLARDGQHPAVEQALADAGLPRETLKRLEALYEEILSHHEPLEVVEPLADGDVVPTGIGGLRVIFTPGHTQGSLCLLAEDGTLFSGDTVLERITPNATLDGGREGRFRALPVYIGSLMKLSELRPGPILPGHGAPFPRLEPVLAQAFARYRERGEKILEFLRKRPATVIEIGEALFGSPRLDQLFLVVSEVYGNLDLLEEHGAVEVIAGHPLRYRAKGRFGSDYPLPSAAA